VIHRRWGTRPHRDSPGACRCRSQQDHRRPGRSDAASACRGAGVQGNRRYPAEVTPPQAGMAFSDAPGMIPSSLPGSAKDGAKRSNERKVVVNSASSCDSRAGGLESQE
jgi:hypothetical protein